MAKFFSHWSYAERGPWSYKVWMCPCGVCSCQGFYPWSATVYYLYIWALHTSGRNWSPRPALRGRYTSIHPLPTRQPANASLVVGEMGHVLGKLETWMSSNRLRLNP